MRLVITKGAVPQGAALFAALMLGGCAARTVGSIVTAPVRVVAKGVDLATTSQSEADEKRGRELRQREERIGRLERNYRRHSAQCQRGDREACEDAQDEAVQIERLSDSLPSRR